LQILELPEGTGDDQPPFILVIDEVTEEESERVIGSKEVFDGMAKKMGARAVAVFHGMTVDIPANTPAPVADDPERAGTTQLVYAHERTRLDLCAALLVSGDTTWRKLVETVTERQRALADSHEARADLTRSENVRDHLREQRDEARNWARHGYEIGQRHCGWTDHGVAPGWLTDGWGPAQFGSCEHLKRASEYDEALTRVRSLPEHPEIMDARHAQPEGYLHGYRIAIRDAKRAAQNERATPEGGG
jgi:hypothetical protein